MTNCKKCNENKHIVNKHFGLCQGCNNERLHGSQFGKQYKHTREAPKSLTSKLNRLKHDVKQGVKPKKIKSSEIRNNRIKQDEEFYEKSFNQSNHKCEECGSQLPKEFRGPDGKVNARWRYSHIVAKSIAPELRHNLDNINHLCIEHHTQWDHGDKASMKIYKKNASKLPRYF
tara:strand:- start:1030 stop:1548 length:519 start_codon:yes stop_codon:yes gene_type:complete